MSDYDSQSEVMRLCQPGADRRAAAGEPGICAKCSRTRQELSRRTDGAFDVTVGPLTDCGAARDGGTNCPTAEQLRRPPEKPSATSTWSSTRRTAPSNCDGPNMRIDLGGIAQGYAADLALAALHAQGIHRGAGQCQR